MNPHNDSSYPFFPISGKRCMFDRQPCETKDWIELVSVKYGLCYQFNSIYNNKEVFKVSRGGEGIKI